MGSHASKRKQMFLTHHHEGLEAEQLLLAVADS